MTINSFAEIRERNALIYFCLPSERTRVECPFSEAWKALKRTDKVIKRRANKHDTERIPFYMEGIGEQLGVAGRPR